MISDEYDVSVLKVMQNCIDMFTVRGYTNIAPDYDEYKIYAENTKNENNEYICLCILNQLKLNKESIKYYYQYFKENHIHRGILVYTNSYTSSVKKIIQGVDMYLELFCIDDLKYNLLKHEYVPKHEKIGTTQTIDATNYPIMLKKDPVAKFMGFKSGDIIKIYRRNGSISKRVVK